MAEPETESEETEKKPSPSPMPAAKEAEVSESPAEAKAEAAPPIEPEAIMSEPPPPPSPPTGGALGAYEALASSPRLSDLVAVARDVVGEAARSRRGGPGFGAKVDAAAEELKLERDHADTPFGNVLEVLRRGPEDAAERALAAALWAHAIAESPRSKAEDEDVLAGDLLWLATHTAYDATSLLDRALGDDADGMWEAIAARVARIDQGKGGALGRAEALVGAAALASSPAPRAKTLAGELARDPKDPVLARLLSPSAEARAAKEVRLEGELISAPRGPVVTALLALTGVLFLVHAVRLLARLALAYRRPAVVSFGDAGVRLETRTEMLGRTLREREHVIVRAGLVRVVREVRYPRLAFYAGLLALALGSYVGVRAFVDGVRSASPSLLLVGLLIVIAGIAADFVLGSLLPGTRGRCRIALVPRAGGVLCVGDVDAKRADAALARTLGAG